MLAHLAMGASWIAVSPILPLIVDEYSINRTTASLLITLPILLVAIISLPSGVIIGRIGVRRTYTLSWLLMTLPVLSPLAPNFAVLLVLRLGAGAGTILGFIAAGPLLMQLFRLRETLVMNGINMAAVSLGGALAFVAMAPLAEVVGWRGALGVFGGVSVLGVSVWIPFSRPIAEPDRVVPAVSLRALWAALSNRTVVILTAAELGVVTLSGALSTWLPSFLNESRGLSLAQSGLVTSLIPFVGTFTVLLAGYASYRLGPSRNFLIVGGLLVALGGPGAFLFDNLVVIYISIIVLGLGTFLYLPVTLSLPMGLPGMTPERLALVWSAIFSVQTFAIFLAPLMVGALRDIYGSFIPGFVVVAVAAWSLFIGGVLLPRGTPARPNI